MYRADYIGFQEVPWHNRSPLFDTDHGNGLPFDLGCSESGLAALLMHAPSGLCLHHGQTGGPSH